MAEIAPPAAGGRILISFIADMSGSMQCIASDVIGTINGLVKDQIDKPGEAFFTLTTFDTVVETPFVAVPVEDMPEIGTETYAPRGWTALLDAIGRTVRATEDVVEDLDPDQVLFMIMTDGYENASKEWNREQVSKLLEEKQDDPEFPWQVAFMGGDLGTAEQVWGQANQLSVSGTLNSLAFDKSAAGMVTASGCAVAATANYRASGIQKSDSYFQTDDE